MSSSHSSQRSTSINLIHRTTPAPATIPNSAPELAPTVPKETDPDPVARDSTPPSTQDAGSMVVPATGRPNHLAPATEQPIRRQNAFYHISNAEDSPWKAPGGYYPLHHGTNPTLGRTTPEQPASPPLAPLHPPGLGHRSHGGGDTSSSSSSPSLPSLPHSQESQPLLSETRGIATKAAPTLGTGTTQPAPSPRPLRREDAFCHVSWLSQPPFVSPGPSTFQSPPTPPTTTSTTPAALNSLPKRKREDAEDAENGDEASDKKRIRRPSADDVN